MWTDVRADPLPETTTPGKGNHRGREEENLQRLSRLSRDYRTGKMPQVDWLSHVTTSML